MKKVLIILFLFLSCSLQAFAVKVLSPQRWDVPQKTQVLALADATEIKVAIGRTRGHVYVANLDCHEYSRVYSLKTATGYTYVRPRQRSVRISRESMDFLNQLFQENANNIYFVSYGYGLFSNYVGEFYIGDKSVSRIMVNQGYCSYVK